MGHSVQTLLDNYAHVIAELSGEHRPVEDLISEARAPQNVPTSDAEHPHNVPTREVRGSRWTPVPLYQAKPSSGLEPETPSLPWSFGLLSTSCEIRPLGELSLQNRGLAG